MKRSTILFAALAALLLASQQTAMALNVVAPGDPIIAIDGDDDYTISSGSSYPAGEAPQYLFDDMYLEGSHTKYLNFGGALSGFIVTPSAASTIQSFTFATANDSIGRTPTSYILWGTNDTIASTDNSVGDGESWTLISEGGLTPPTTLYTVSDAVSFANSSSYSSYRMIFPTLDGEPLMQLSEMSFYESSDATGTDVTTGAGGSALAIRIPEDPYLTNSGSPGAEGVANVIDGDSGTKYLNYAGAYSGFIVTPTAGSSVVEAFRITTANDAPERDPSQWELYGTNEEIASGNNGPGVAENWTLIDTGSMELPEGRLTASSIISVDNASQAAYTSYKMVFPQLKGQIDNPASNPLFQIADIELLQDDPVTLVIDRTTGAVSIRAEEAVTIGSYEIVSASYGSLDADAWTPLADGGVDPDDTWVVDGDAEATRVAEGATTGGAENGYSLATGATISLGDLFLLTPYDDIRLNIYDEAGTLISQSIEFLGDALIAGDYNADGVINVSDYNLFLAGFGGYYPDLSPAQAYLLGDMDGDLDSDLEDFILLAQAAGGIEALTSSTAVPEPSTGLLLLTAGVLLGLRRKMGHVVAMVAAVAAGLFAANQANAFFYVSSGIPTATTPDQLENAASGPQNLFDDTFLDSAGINTELFNFNYNSPDPDVVVGAQYSSFRAEPKRVFFDYGSTVSANSFAFAQRAGAIPDADRVGTWEFWFSDTPFGESNDTLPAREADSVFKLDGDDARQLDSYLRPYPLNDDYTFQYAAMRITVAEVSAANPSTNIGGNEFRFTQGPSAVVLEVNRDTGELTLTNNGSNAQSFNLRALEIESQYGGLATDLTGYDGLGGNPGFNDADWTVGGGANGYFITDSMFNGTSTLAAGASISLGIGYNVDAASEDISLRFAESSLGDFDSFSGTYGKAHMFDGVVVYTGTGPTKNPGDFNDDGMVDIADYAVWRNNLGGSAAGISWNGMGGFVTIADYQLWKDNFGTVYGAGSLGATAVPEPASVLLLVSAAGLCLVGRSRRRG